MVTYKLGLPLSTKIFNFNPFVNRLDLDEFLLNPNILPCKCINSPFADKYHKHVVTGDLRIIDNYHLRKLFTKGPKFIRYTSGILNSGNLEQTLCGNCD